MLRFLLHCVPPAYSTATRTSVWLGVEIKRVLEEAHLIKVFSFDQNWNRLILCPGFRQLGRCSCGDVVVERGKEYSRPMFLAQIRGNLASQRQNSKGCALTCAISFFPHDAHSTKLHVSNARVSQSLFSCRKALQRLNIWIAISTNPIALHLPNRACP
jgi:hypothetical protein